MNPTKLDPDVFVHAAEMVYKKQYRGCCAALRMAALNAVPYQKALNTYFFENLRIEDGHYYWWPVGIGITDGYWWPVIYWAVISREEEKCTIEPRILALLLLAEMVRDGSIVGAELP